MSKSLHILQRQRRILMTLAWLVFLSFTSFFWLPVAHAAATPLAQQPALIKTIELGTISGELKFVPDRLTFQTGRRYQLTLTNPSPTKHYFTAKDFADAIWSQKVDAGNVEIKGAIHELELRPGSHADWVFVPLRAGIYNLRCTIPGHAAAGMIGTMEITG